MARKRYDLTKSDGVNLQLFEPKSDWRPPSEFPDLSGAKVLGIDCETRDPQLIDMGPGSFRRDGYVVGISLATIDRSWYFPIRHLGGGNMDYDAVIRYVRDLVRDTSRTFIGANTIYDVEWLDSVGCPIGGKVVDVQLVEALLDEEATSYSLNNLCLRHLGRGKDEDLLRDAARSFGVDPKSGLWKLHSRYVGPYAQFDAQSVLQVFAKQWTKIQEEDLEKVFTLESDLTPLIWLMRKQGIRVDLEEAEKTSAEIKKSEDSLRLKIKHELKRDIDEWSGDVIAGVFDDLKMIYPRTARGNPSFESEWLENHTHWFPKALADLREFNRLRKVFIDQWIFKNQIDGIVHPVWRQTRDEEGGTRSGRMAASNPNPQQVPSRSDLAPLIRKLFIPHSKEYKWGKYDYSQQEPRLAVHFANICKLTGADIVALAYRENPKMDIYKFLAEAAQVTRRESKDITLGRFYGMGKDKLAAKLGCTVERAAQILSEFDRSVPFIKELADICSNRASTRGWIKTLLGRKRHFNLWEPAKAFEMRKAGTVVVPCSENEAKIRWPGYYLVRAFTHKALNSLIQGSAADMTKAAMLRNWKELNLVPIMQVHDELNYNVLDDKQSDVIRYNLETAVNLTVPVYCDPYLGGHWK